MGRSALIAAALLSAFVVFRPVFYLVPFGGDTRSLTLRMPAAYGMTGREVECEIRAAELRRVELTRYARCESVPTWRHWLNVRSVDKRPIGIAVAAGLLDSLTGVFVGEFTP